MIQDEAIQENTDKVDLVNEKATANEENIQGNIGAILDNTDNIGITAGRVTTNVAHIATTNLPRVLEEEPKLAVCTETVAVSQKYFFKQFSTS